MAPIAYFGIHSSALNLAVDLVILFLAILYLSLVFWTFADARRRIADPLLVVCAAIVGVVPFVGPIVYMVLRPPEYLQDAHEQELEIRAAEARVAEMEASLCPHCDYPIEKDFICCPSCLTTLKERCRSCSRPLDRAWTICPYCETEVPDPVLPPRRSRRAGERPDPVTSGGQSRRETEISEPAPPAKRSRTDGGRGRSLTGVDPQATVEANTLLEAELDEQRLALEEGGGEEAEERASTSRRRSPSRPARQSRSSRPERPR